MFGQKFTDSFIMVVYGENAFWVAGDFFRCCNTSGHWYILAAGLSDGAISSSFNTQCKTHNGLILVNECTCDLFLKMYVFRKY